MLWDTFEHLKPTSVCECKRISRDSSGRSAVVHTPQAAGTDWADMERVEKLMQEHKLCLPALGFWLASPSTLDIWLVCLAWSQTANPILSFQISVSVGTASLALPVLRFPASWPELLWFSLDLQPRIGYYRTYQTLGIGQTRLIKALFWKKLWKGKTW